MTKPNGIWKLVHWVRERSYLLPEPPVIPPLRKVRNEETIQVADTMQGKANLLRERFFPQEPEADISDIEGYQYPLPAEQLPYINKDDV